MQLCEVKIDPTPESSQGHDALAATTGGWTMDGHSGKKGNKKLRRNPALLNVEVSVTLSQSISILIVLRLALAIMEKLQALSKLIGP